MHRITSSIRSFQLNCAATYGVDALGTNVEHSTARPLCGRRSAGHVVLCRGLVELPNPVQPVGIDRGVRHRVAELE